MSIPPDPDALILAKVAGMIAAAEGRVRDDLQRTLSDERRERRLLAARTAELERALTDMGERLAKLERIAAVVCPERDPMD